jgi:hypothetical protein
MHIGPHIGGMIDIDRWHDQQIWKFIQQNLGYMDQLYSADPEIGFTAHRPNQKPHSTITPWINITHHSTFSISQRLLGTSLRGFWPSPRGFWPWTLMTRVWDPQEINPTIPQGPGGSNDVQGSVSYPSCGPIHGLVFKCVALVTLDTAAPKVAGAQRTSA